MTTEVLERLQKLSPQQRELVLKQLRAKQAGEAKPAAVGIVPVPKAAKIPLSFSQSRLWFLYQQMDEKNAAYNVPLFWQLKGNLDQVALEQSLSALMQRHEILRTCFRVVDDEAVQVIRPVSAWVLPVRDLRHLPASERLGETQRLANADMETHFDLETAPLMRAQLLRLDEDWHVLLLVMHHIIVDGWSMGIFTDELAMCYQAFRQQQSPVLPPLKLQYADYAHWQRQWLGGEHLDKQLAYWKRQLENVPDLLQLPTDRPRPAVMTYVGSSEFLTLDAATTAGLQQLSREAGCTLFMTLLAAFNVLLARYSRQDDICIGSPIANRHRREIEPLIGFFANTLVFRSRLDMQASFRNLLQQVKQMTLDAYAHQDMPFEKLVEELKPKRSLSYNPLFQVMFIMQNMPGMNASLPDLQVEALDFDNQTTQFDLSLTAKESGRQLEMEWEFNTDLFGSPTIRYMKQHFQGLLHAVVHNPEQTLQALPMQVGSEVGQLLAWNQTAKAYPQDATLASLFQQQVMRTPEHIAVSFAGQQLTYQQLNTQANQLAYHLLHYTACRDDRNPLVAICLNRSLDMAVALLGILKAGAAYVPIDPAYPEERIRYMLENSQAKVVLTHSTVQNALSLPMQKYEVLFLDEADFTAYPTEDVEAQSGAGDLGYVIYTSGSTGKPKGVALPQRALVNLMCWQRTVPGLDTAAITLQFTTLSFDVSFQEFFSTWFAGGQLVLVDEDTRRDAHALLAYLTQHRVERLFVPFVMLQHLAEQFDPAEHQGLVLQDIITAGEQLRITPAIRQLFMALPDCRLHNHYGPSESHVVTALTLPAKRDEWADLPSIGRPIDNNRIYILDSLGQPAPIGIPGELCIAGDNLAQGYFNNPELTAEKFIVADMFAQQERIYKTGDLARWLPDGNLVCMGRIDHQVKLRGFRIEPGEIEVVLAQHFAVRENVVVIHEAEGSKRLVAYVSLDPGLDLKADMPKELRHFLQARLPDYMVPAHIQVLDALPLTPNGKVDRRSLPEPDRDFSRASREMIEPRTALELQLLQIWEEVLQVRNISVYDNFFELGGNSLLAASLVSRIERKLGKRIPLTLLFQGGTIVHQAEFWQQSHAPDEWSTLVPLKATGSNTPLFFVHPGAGTVIWYRYLARHLSPEQPLYGIESQGLEEGQEPFDRVDAMAAYYIATLKTLQPQGPYLIAGWCFGGVVAFEMAQQLMRQGEQVAFLGMLDTPVSFELTDECVNEVLLFVRLLRRDVPHLSEFHAGIAHLDEDTQLQQLLEQVKQVGQLPADFELEQTRRMLAVFRGHLIAASVYKPQPYAGKVHFFQAGDGEARQWDDPTMGWSAFAADRQVEWIPGDHMTMVTDPNVQFLAEKLEQYFARIMP